MRLALEQQRQQHNATCRKMILDFNASVSRSMRRDTRVVERVRKYCHAAMDIAHPHRLHAELRHKSLEVDASAGSAANGRAAQAAATPWRYDGLDLSTPWQSQHNQRLPKLAYIVLISPNDSASAGT